MTLSLVIALAAGFVSFLSPCVLPIIPAFLAYLAGTTATDASPKRWSVFINSIFFVLGFSVVFATIGVLLNSILASVAATAQQWTARVGGLVIIFFGLVLTGLVEVPWLQREHTLRVRKGSSSRLVASFLFGASFAAGWTPCVGAVLGGILGLAAAQPARSFTLLLGYSIGLGIPFLLVGLFASQAKGFIQRHAKSLGWVSRAFGGILILLGILAFTQRLSLIANWSLLNQCFLRS